jgi:hypothetical protein
MTVPHAVHQKDTMIEERPFFRIEQERRAIVLISDRHDFYILSRSRI